MTIRELKIVLKPLKKKMMEQCQHKKDDLLRKYHEWRHRPEPSFCVESVKFISKETDEIDIDAIGHVSAV